MARKRRVGRPKGTSNKVRISPFISRMNYAWLKRQKRSMGIVLDRLMDKARMKDDEVE